MKSVHVLIFAEHCNTSPTRKKAPESGELQNLLSISASQNLILQVNVQQHMFTVGHC